jgi:hypothetical protein
MIIGLIMVVGAFIGYRTLHSRQPIHKDYEAGAVSQRWLLQQRGDPKDY